MRTLHTIRKQKSMSRDKVFASNKEIEHLKSGVQISQIH